MNDEVLSAVKKAPLLNFKDVSKNIPRGLVMEFGVAAGDSIKQIAISVTDQTIYGFDCWEGLPESWYNLEAGHFACETPKDLPENVKLIKGLFQDTVPKFVKENKNPVSFMHIDCDLYSATKCVFDNFKDRFQDGSVIAFDELIDYGGELWRLHEYKAFNEFLEDTKYNWECIGRWGAHQAAFKIWR